VALDVLLTWGTTRFGHVEVDHKPRAVGRSTYTLRKLIAHAMTMMTGFSVVPLRLASYLGFTLTFFGLLLLIYIVPIRALLGFEGVPGFTFLGSVIAIFSGAQMFTIGIIGEYIARVHFRLMDKPTYVVFAETTGASQDE
jgi:undecaprenyl-phosphate 4-deoxy-4-formamido-L-arabinose transferase